MKPVTFEPIGVIHSDIKNPNDAPRSERMAEGIEATVEIFPEFSDGLADLDGFSHIILITHFHLSKKKPLIVTPFLDNVQRGVFATRSPNRPNAIGMSTVRLKSIENNILYITNTEMVDGTPVLDIKPHIPLMYNEEDIKIGWLTGKRRDK
jgi:tRNA (adenine37-N6)-methyltransferase